MASRFVLRDYICRMFWYDPHTSRNEMLNDYQCSIVMLCLP